ncbi:hypothetical protein AB0N23_07500 [Streptomyces sp. NPDC052644]
MTGRRTLALAGWLGGVLMTYAAGTGCNVCADSVCGGGNSGNGVAVPAAGPTPAPGGTGGPGSAAPGGKPPGTTAPGPLTKAQYVKEADALCQRWNQQAEKYLTSDAEPSWELFTTLMRLGTSMADEWRAMPPPAGDTGEADTFVEKQYADVAAMRRVRDLWAAGDTDRAQVELERLSSEEAQAERRAEARAYGFRVCY